MYEKVGFYNHYGNGDIFESREFVRTIMKLLPATEYVYYNGKSPRLLMDIPNLRVDNIVPAKLLPTSPVIVEENSIYINTWIGRDSRYVRPGIGCTIEMLYKMYNDILRKFGVQLPGTPIDYLTTIDYSHFDILKIGIEMGRYKDKKKVYISNGGVHSSQADNFDMTALIIRLAFHFPDILFFVTQSLGESSLINVIDANTMVSPRLNSNLMELSYLSTFCDVLIGRNSGPHVFTWTKENCATNKANITFSYRRECHHFVHDTPIAMKRFWSGATTTDEIFPIVQSIIKKEIE